MKYSNVRYHEWHSETLILNPKEALGVLDLRLLGYYKLQQGVLKQNLEVNFMNLNQQLILLIL